jgi:hypothetical protein
MQQPTTQGPEGVCADEALGLARAYDVGAMPDQLRSRVANLRHFPRLLVQSGHSCSRRYRSLHPSTACKDRVGVQAAVTEVTPYMWLFADAWFRPCGCCNVGNPVIVCVCVPASFNDAWCVIARLRASSSGCFLH